MNYRVKASLVPDKLAAFHQVLTDGTVHGQRPDGPTIVAAMKGAKITGPNVIEWNEVCYCATPLAHERETVYDSYVTDISTDLMEEFEDIEGASFWSYLESVVKSP